MLALASCYKREKVLVFIRSDSFGVGVGSTGAPSSLEYINGADVKGDFTWGKRLQSLLDERSDFQYIVDIKGYPGQTANWYVNSNQLKQDQHDLVEKSKSVKYVVFCAAFGTNDEAQLGVNDSTSVQRLISDERKIDSQFVSLPELSSRIATIAYPLTNRVDIHAKPNTNAFRNKYNYLIGNTPKLVDASLTMDYKSHPDIYADDAPGGNRFAKNDRDKLSGVHLNNAGYADLAHMTNDAVIDALKQLRLDGKVSSKESRD